MIITTVILFLKDLLPIFVLFCYLSVFFEKQKITLAFMSLIALGGILSTFALFTMAEVISDLFEGAGLELTFVILLFLFYVSGVYFSLRETSPIARNKVMLFICITTFIAIEGAGFLVFFSVTEQHTGSLQNVLLGCIVGLGICSSFSALFRFLLSELKQSRYEWVFTLLWSAFLAGQASKITSLLSQVDIISTGAPLFDASRWVEDSSEYGHILNALFGYESSPTLAMSITYVIAFVIPITIRSIVKIKLSAREVAHA
jgi:high-affinity iron transporter